MIISNQDKKKPLAFGRARGGGTTQRKLAERLNAMYIYSIPKHIYKFNIAGCNGGVMVIGLLLQVKDKDHAGGGITAIR
jgi:hypothetical protein